MQLSIGEHTVAVRVEGNSSPAVLFAHSTGMGSIQWVRAARTLAPRRCVMPDFLGYGASSAAPGRRKDWRVDLEALVQLACAQDAPVTVVGHSYGGFLALQLARHHPERVARVVVHEPVLWGTLRSGGDATVVETFEALVARMRAVERGGEAWLEGFVDFWNGPGMWAKLPSSRADQWRRDGAHIAAEVHGLIDDTTPHTTWSSLQMPVLLTVGENTASIESHVCDVLQGVLPNGTRRQVPGGHMAPLTNGRSWLDAVVPWMTRDDS